MKIFKLSRIIFQEKMWNNGPFSYLVTNPPSICNGDRNNLCFRAQDLIPLCSHPEISPSDNSYPLANLYCNNFSRAVDRCGADLWLWWNLCYSWSLFMRFCRWYVFRHIWLSWQVQKKRGEEKTANAHANAQQHSGGISPWEKSGGLVRPTWREGERWRFRWNELTGS